MSRYHIAIIIDYDLKNPERTAIRTNAKKETLEEILETFLHAQVGAGEDDRRANEKDEYKIAIYLDLTDDTFKTESDTGNDGLTCGIVADVLQRIKNVRVTPLS